MPRARQDAELLGSIDEIRGEHEFAATYGSARVWPELRNRAVRVGCKRVERIMRQNGRQGLYLRRGYKHGSTRPLRYGTRSFVLAVELLVRQAH